MHKYLLLRNDVIFKNVFYRNNSILKEWLKDLLSVIHLEEKWDNQTLDILNTELTKDRLYIKNKTIDIKLNLGNQILNMEMNNNYFYDHDKNRNTFYLLNMSLESIHTDHNYRKIKPVTQINFTFRGKTKRGIEYKGLLDEKYHFPYIDWIKIININVDYFLDEWYNSLNKEKYFEKYKSILVLGLNRKQLKSMEVTGYMEKIRHEVDALNRSPGFYQLFTDEEDQEMLKNSMLLEGLEQGMEKGLEQGIEQGIEQGMEKGSLIEKLNIAENLIRFGMKPNDISKNTGLSKDIINSLIHN